MRVYREAIIAAKKGDVSEVFLKWDVNKFQNHPVFRESIRLDITVCFLNGNIDIVSVPLRGENPIDVQKKSIQQEIF